MSDLGLSATSKPPPVWAHGKKLQIGSVRQARMPHGCKKCHRRICTCD